MLLGCELWTVKLGLVSNFPCLALSGTSLSWAWKSRNWSEAVEKWVNGSVAVSGCSKYDVRGSRTGSRDLTKSTWVDFGNGHFKSSRVALCHLVVERSSIVLPMTFYFRAYSSTAVDRRRRAWCEWASLFYSPSFKPPLSPHERLRCGLRPNSFTTFFARDVIYTSRAYATMSVSICLSVCLSVSEVHWRIIANLGFKFRSQFTAHCGRGACGRKH